MPSQNGVMHLIGHSGMTNTLSFYCDDTAGDPFRFNQAVKTGATSPTDWIPPEPVILTDVIFGAAPTVTTQQTSTVESSPPILPHTKAPVTGTLAPAHAPASGTLPPTPTDPHGYYGGGVLY
jgi:hypothetical protein